jgi:glycosyltransferase involved in cell wall biosynthesis
LDRGLRVCLVTFAGAEEDFFALDTRSKRIILEASGTTRTLLGGFFANVTRLVRLRKALAATSPKSIVSFTGTTNILTVLAARNLESTVIVSERNDPTKQSLGFPWDYLRRRLYRDADRVTAISKGTLQHMTQFVPKDKLVVTPLLIEPPASVPAAPIPRPAILSVARMDPQKGHDILIRAFAKARDRVPDWYLVLVGDGPLRSYLQRLVAELALDDCVCFEGRQENPFSYYSAADIFAFPSRFEGMGNVLLEAMSYGVPPIVSDASPGPLEVVTDRETGLVARAEDDSDLATKLEELMLDPTLRATLGEAAQKRMQEYGRNAFRVWDELIGLE